jgi:hypothetical protein
MPDFFCHVFLGKAAVPSMPAFFQEAVGMHASLFHLGCQGPDIFFYHKMLSPGAHRRAGAFANTCHGKDTRKLLAYGASFLKEHRDDREFAAYWAGFLCHYALDSSAHPFIEAHAQGFRAHKRLEMHLDAYLLHKKWASAPYRVRIQRLIELTDGLPASVIAFWQGLAQKVYTAELVPAVVRGSYRGICAVNGMYYTPHARTRGIKKRLGGLFGLDISPYLTDFEGQGPLLTGPEYAEFEARFGDAYALAASLSAKYAALLEGECTMRELKAALPNINFSGKKPGKA